MATPLAELADEMLSLTVDQFAMVAATLDDDDLAMVERAIAYRTGEGWRTDPLSMAAHLTGGKTKAWKYSRLLGQQFVKAVEGESKRQIWNLPARYGKTTVSSQWGPVWMLDRYPHLKIILTSYGDKLAKENAGTVRDLLDEHHDELRVAVRQDRRARGGWRTSEGGMVLAAGVGSTMTGYGGDVIVVDDPFKNWVEAHSETTRESVWNWYRSVVRTRLQTDDSAIIVVMTRWHEDDLVGRLLNPPEGEGEDWELVLLPALAEPSQAESEQPDFDLDEGCDMIGRKVGDVLEPERFSVDGVNDRHKALGPYLTAGMEQQRPAPAEGGIVKRAWWRYFDRLPDPLSLEDWLISWDSSFKDAETSDFVVGGVWCRSGSRRYLVDLVRDRMDYPTFRQAVANLAMKWPQARKILIEDSANGPAVIADLKLKISGLTPRTAKGSKISRVHAVSGDISSGSVWIPDPNPATSPWAASGRDVSWVAEYVNEHAAFPNATHDDQVDMTSMALLEYDNAMAELTGDMTTLDRVSALDGRR